MIRLEGLKVEVIVVKQQIRLGHLCGVWSNC